jgi:hypothetical protein
LGLAKGQGKRLDWATGYRKSVVLRWCWEMGMGMGMGGKAVGWEKVEKWRTRGMGGKAVGLRTRTATRCRTHSLTQEVIGCPGDRRRPSATDHPMIRHWLGCWPLPTGCLVVRHQRRPSPTGGRRAQHRAMREGTGWGR